MSKKLESILLSYPRPYLTDIELKTLLVDHSADSRYGIVKRLLAQKKLIHIRRGLYCLTDKLGYFKKAHPFELAQYIEGPSYVSFESALSYHQLIPEAVYTVMNATIRRSKQYRTELGAFNYIHLPADNFYTDVCLVKEDNYLFFMANPWKALCDYVFYYKKDWINLDPLIHSLRIDVESLPQLSEEKWHELNTFYHHVSVSRFLKCVRNELMMGAIYER